MSIRQHQQESLSFPIDRPPAKAGVAPRREPLTSRVRTRTSHLGRRWLALGESGMMIFAILMYFLVRGMMSTSVDTAHENALKLLDLERSLGIAWESAMQGWVSGTPWLSGLVNSIYIYGHWPVIALTLAWLLWRHKGEFRIVRNAMVISGLIGFVFFALYPMAPPRFLTELGFVDTVMRDTSSYRVLQPPAFTNQYAAMPSLHVGWNLLMGIAIFRTTRHLFWRAFAVIMPLAMYLSTILTANHFVLDGIVGSLVALTGLAIARYLYGRKGKTAHDGPDPRPGSRGRPLDLAPAGDRAVPSGHAG